MSSRSKETLAAIRPSALISTMPSTSVRNASGAGRGRDTDYDMRTRRSPRVAMMVDVMLVDPEVGDRPHVRDLDVPTVPDPGVHHPTTIVDCRMSSASISAMASQSRAAKYARKRSPTRLAAFSSRGACGCSSSKRASAASRSASSKSSTRSDQVAFDREQVDHPPLGIEALLRGPMRRMGDDRSEVVQPMHRLDIDAEVGVTSSVARR